MMTSMAEGTTITATETRLLMDEFEHRWRGISTIPRRNINIEKVYFCAFAGSSCSRPLKSRYSAAMLQGRCLAIDLWKMQADQLEELRERARNDRGSN